MLVAASLLLLASALMGLTSSYLVLFAAGLALQVAFEGDLLGSGLCAALSLTALWSETALSMVQVGVLAGVKPASEGHVGAGAGLAAAAFLCLLGVPWAVALVPLLAASFCAAAVWYKRRSLRLAGLSMMALMTDQGECRYLRGIMTTILLAYLIRRLVR
ncbi:MAG: hypothetical protein HY303_13880 [Candidatus Wallbacteria bacterium]|nr:hypothetical protein [Candidatus Wallbacteria bacterium]